MLLNNIVERLRQSGHKVTPQRVIIIRTLLESTELLTPSALYEKARMVDPQLGEVTVYRTLNILSELGLACVVHTGENTLSYIGRPVEHHDHLICSDCGKVINFTNGISKLEKRLASETGFIVGEHRDFYGRCRDCSEKVAKPG